LLPPLTMPQSCLTRGGLRIEACPTQLQPEGIPTRSEERLFLDLSPLVAAGDYAAVLERIRMDYGAELALLEAGDFEGFLQTRKPTDGRSPLAPIAAPGRPGAPPIDDGQVHDRDVRASRNGNVFAEQRGLEQPPNTISASLLYVIGHSYFSLQRYVPAETAFKLALRALPNHVRAHESLGFLYLRTERYAEARTHLARAVQLGRNTANVYAALGYLDEKIHRYAAAAAAFQRALVLEPGDRAAQRGLLYTLTETHEHAKARALVEQLLEKEPDDPTLWLYRAQIALAADDRPAALASLEAALRLGDDSAANRETCIELLMESGNVAGAVRLLQGSSARGVAFPLVDRALGWLADADEWDDFRKLVASVDIAAFGGAERSRLLTRRASLALHERNRRAARTALQEALALDPSNAEALMALGQLYGEDREYGRADLLFRRASDYAPFHDDALIARAGLAADQGDYDGALTLLRGIVAGDAAGAGLRRNVDVLENLALLRTQR
jgi:tetratricopeptide (TPR) repeat protein